MEHRCAERKPIELNVLVASPRMGLVRGQTLDLCAGGMFIKADHVEVPVNAPVTVSFQPDVDLPLVCFQAKGMVVHIRAGGFGFMFDDLEPACERALQRLLAGDDGQWMQRQLTDRKAVANV